MLKEKKRLYMIVFSRIYLYLQLNKQIKQEPMIKMHTRLSICIGVILLCGGNLFNLNAQVVNNINNLNIEEYTKISLPPLDILFENAKNAPSYELAAVKEEVEKKLLKKEKIAFLRFFNIRGSWQYGTFANDGYLSSVIEKPVYSYTKTDQTLYSIGASVSIPLDELFDLGERVKRQKLNLRAAELEKEVKYQELKKEIVELYAQAVSQLNIVRLRSEATVLANAQYEISERNFINGTMTSAELAVQKENQSVIIQRFEDSKFELNKSLMILEVITQTPIIRK